MAGKYGADVEQLRQLARQMSSASEQLNRSRLTVGNQIKISAWVGPFAATFKAQWESEHSVRVATVARLLEENAAKLRTNADEQERASAADGGAGGSSRQKPIGSPSGPGGLADFADDLLPELRRMYELLTTIDGQTGLIKYLLNPKLLGKLGWMSALTSIYDLIADGQATWDDIQSGNIWRFAKAIFRTGWTLAKINPVVGLVDAAAQAGLGGGSMIMDGIFGPGASEKAFTDLGNSINDAGNNVNDTLAGGGAWIGGTIGTGVRGFVSLFK